MTKYTENKYSLFYDQPELYYTEFLITFYNWHLSFSVRESNDILTLTDLFLIYILSIIRNRMRIVKEGILIIYSEILDNTY